MISKPENPKVHSEEKRILTIVGQSAYNYKEAPTIRLHGRWLEELGFIIGEKVTVEEEHGRLVIYRVEDKNDRKE